MIKARRRYQVMFLDGEFKMNDAVNLVSILNAWYSFPKGNQIKNDVSMDRKYFLKKIIKEKTSLAKGPFYLDVVRN